MLNNATNKDLDKSGLNPNKEFYFNSEGLLVFTKEYHLKRGFCCKNACLHCPWNYKKKL
jgi:hypothetical protein